MFFDSPEPLALGDANERNDVYEWTNGKLQLVSTGTSPSDSKLLSVSADGKDVFFFTRQEPCRRTSTAVLVRLYTAREGDGFTYGPPKFSCAASDECHGPGSQAAPQAVVGTVAGTPTGVKSRGCSKGKVRRKGK